MSLIINMDITSGTPSPRRVRRDFLDESGIEHLPAMATNTSSNHGPIKCYFRYSDSFVTAATNQSRHLHGNKALDIGPTPS